MGCSTEDVDEGSEKSSDSNSTTEAASMKPRKREGSSPPNPQDKKKQKIEPPSEVASDPNLDLGSSLRSSRDSDISSSSQVDNPEWQVIDLNRQQSASVDYTDIWGQLLPLELILKILQTVVDAFGPLPTLLRVSEVNKRWNSVAQESILWRKLYSSVGWISQNERMLDQLVQSKNLTQLREANFSQWKNFTTSGIQLLANNCVMLTSVNLSGTRVTSSGISYLLDRCPDLTSLNFSAMKGDALDGNTFSSFQDHQGYGLESLNMSSNVFKDCHLTLNNLMRFFPKLKVLNISNAQVTSEMVMLDIDKLRAGCPRLEILKLGNSAFKFFFTEEVDCQGFPDLKDLDLGMRGFTGFLGCDISNNCLQRILKRSHDLKSLDIRGCTSVTCESLQSLPITDLEVLLMSNSPAASYTGIEVVLRKWQHSLIVLDLSWNIHPGMSLDMAMKKLSSDPTKSKLEKLDLSGTQISCEGIQSILKGCPRLNCLRLNSCYGIPRGMKKEYSGSNIVQLRQDIASIVAQA